MKLIVRTTQIFVRKKNYEIKNLVLNVRTTLLLNSMLTELYKRSVTHYRNYEKIK